MRRTHLLYLAVTWIALMCATLAAQETTGGIEGTIKDSTGAVVPNIAVSITNAKGTVAGTSTGFRRSITSDGDGFFRAIQVPPGIYDVTTESSAGFGATSYENIVVKIGQTTQVTISVKPGTSVTTVDVSASEAAPVDTTNSSIQTTVDSQRIELLPKGTGFASLLKTVPGTRPESRSGGFSVDGSSGAENVFVIDGQEVTNFRTGTLNDSYSIPTQMVREVQVKSTGFDAEFGGATGGVISVVTKGGADLPHGEFGIQFETPELNGSARPLLTRFTTGSIANGNFQQFPEYFNPQKLGGANFFPTANMSGKIIKDRLWYFASYSPQYFDTNVDTQYFTDAPAATRTFITTERYSRSRKYEYAFSRIDANPFDSLRVSSTFLWNPIIDQGSIPTSSFSNVSTSAIAFGNVPTAAYGGSIGTLRGNEYTSKQGGRQTSNLFTIEGVYTPTSNLVITSRYTRGFLNEKLGNYFVPTGITISGCANAPTNFNCQSTANNSKTDKDVSLRQTFDFSVGYIFNAAGRHEIKGGYQRFKIFNDVLSGNPLIGSITFRFNTPISTTVPGVVATATQIGNGQFNRTGTIGSGENLSQGIFIQDKYQPTHRLTLNLGVRFEQEDLPSFNEFPSSINFGWGDKIAPRLGFAYDITGDGHTKVFASYGLFFDRVKFALPRGLFGGDIQLDDFFEMFPGQTQTAFNINTIVGGFTGVSICPSTGFIAPGALSRCQKNGRVTANSPGATFTSGGAVDPNLKPFRQTEFTVGVERQFGKNYVLRSRYTYKNVDEAVEDAGTEDTNNEQYIIGNPGTGLHLQRLQALGYVNAVRPQRRYDGWETVLERRLANNWYFNANYTFSRLYGNYTGLSSSDEPHLLDGRLAPGVSRAFDLPFIGFTAKGVPDNGRLPTDRPHVFNVYGAYIINWGSKTNSTELSGFQTITSGTPMTTSIYGASTRTPQILFGRGDLGRSPVYSQTDFNVTHRYRFGRDTRFTMAFDFNVINLFDQKTVTGIYPTMNPSGARVNYAALGLTPVQYANGYTTGAILNQILDRINAQADRQDLRYKSPQVYQSPRAIRFGMRLLF
jgi:hypothetical protein